MAPLMTATLPLDSCRTRHLHSQYGDRAGFRAAIEADPAAGAVVAFVVGGVHSVAVELRFELQDFRGTRLDAKAAALAFITIYLHQSTRNRCHAFTSCGYSRPPEAGRATWCARS